MLYVRLIHILFFGPLLVWLGVSRHYTIGAAAGILVIAKWMWRLTRKDYTADWLLWHILMIGGLLIAYATMKEKTPRFVLAIMISTGFGAMGYHLLRLLKK